LAVKIQKALIFNRPFFTDPKLIQAMPIHRSTETIRPTQSEFGQIAYDVMDCVYAIHNDFGRFFDEAVYKRELADRTSGMELELPVTLTHGTFSKLYKLLDF
jgi:hypothetical protein